MKSPEMQEIRNNLIQAIKRNIAENIQLWEQVANFQSKCNHTQVYSKLSSDTGNYDPSQDDYWIDSICPECGKSFCVFASQNEEAYLDLRRRTIKEVMSTAELIEYSPWKN
jgi:hypothetical protein